MPTQQKAFLLTSREGTHAVGHIDVPTPGPGELLIKVEAAALNPIDWKALQYGLVQTFPAVLGSEAAGVVQTVGAGVVNFSTGDRVMFPAGEFCDRFCTFKQYTLAEAELVAKIPITTSFEEAATLPVGLSTAACTMYDEHPGAGVYSMGLTPPWAPGGRGKHAGTPLVIIGGASARGQSAIGLAKLSGFTPIVVTASAHNAARLLALGATHVLDRALSTDAPALRAAVAGIVAGVPVTAVLDALSAPDTQNTACALLAPGGQLVVYGPDAIEPENKREDRVVRLGYAMMGVPSHRTTAAGLYAHVAALLEEGAIKPNRVEILPGGFGGIAAGLERLKNNEVSGTKLVVRPAETE